MPAASAPRTARARARAEITAEILAAGRRQLAEVGAAQLSLRAVARELGMVSSAVYRYVASRDELLTLLIVDSYDSLGAAAEAAAEASRRRSARNRWVDVARAVRAWALEHPHEYALLYGSPVPGYEAPQDTVLPGTRVSRLLVSVVAEAAAARPLEPTLGFDPPAATAAELRDLAALLEVDLPAPVLGAALVAWTQLFGLVGFEVFGQTRGLVADHEAFFVSATTAMASAIGL
ncbi:MAG TPA: TetR/AcrR family transcriptional regulator [Acidimicrobiales bacterium]|nr:TetR/AcrR family transcriptional regulator [Acidimicrobiales bacterium]